MKCDQLIYRSMVNKSQEKTKNSLECWNMKLRWMDHVDKRPNLLLPLIECLRHKVYCRLFLFLHPSVRPSAYSAWSTPVSSLILYLLSALENGAVVCKNPPSSNRPPILTTLSWYTAATVPVTTKDWTLFPFSLSFCKPPPHFSLSCAFLSVYQHTYIAVQRFHIISIEFFPFLSLSPSGRMTYFVMK